MVYGHTYSAPFGVAPMGGPGIAWPGADRFLAAAALAANLPYVLGSYSGITIEEAATIAPDSFWFQLYHAPNNDHAIGFDLIERAERAGAHALVLTLDVPVRTTRPREVSAGLSVPFRPTLRMATDLLCSPRYLTHLIRRGQPRFANLYRYVGGEVSVEAIDQFSQE